MPRRRTNWLPWIAITVLVLAVFSGAIFLQANNSLQLPFELPFVSFLREDNPGSNRNDSRRGKIPVPTAAATIPAYSKVRREHLWDVKRGQLRVIYMDPDQIPDGVLVDLSKIVGRVLDHDKQPGYVFTEDDFYPRGTREGLVAGVPAEKMMMLIEAKKVAGLHGLRPGDRFDVIETIPVDSGAANLSKRTGGIYAETIALDLEMSNWKKQAEVRVVVRGASVVSPVAMRAQPAVGKSLNRGSVPRTVPIQEIYIAVDPSEVAPLSRALAVESDVRAVVRSGHADAGDDVTPQDLKPTNPLSAMLSGGQGRFSVVEQIRRGERQLTTIPRFDPDHDDSDHNDADTGFIEIVPTTGPAKTNKED